MVLDLRVLNNLVVVAQEANISRAAERLNLSQPALSRSIAQLEAKFGLRLLDGIVGFIFKGTGGGVQVRTPSAVASVRSTEWAMRWSNGVSEVFTREGTVAVSANGGSVGLGPGDGVDVSGSGEFKPVVQWKPPRIARFGELLGADW